MLGNHEEKRNFYRMNTDNPVTFNVMGNHQSHQGQCLNLSGSGILIATDQKLEANTQLKVCLASRQETVPPLLAIVEVIRAEEHPSGTHYIVAGTIKEILQ
ncbi:MAG: hypothetical protein A2V90_07895 [Gammaproteobacteria bacterium RBG_16_57_12]|nr:MAG: hypothetical protein A2V90_07895 [Gammaproteobacteria bacterium RBG_16_57_12]